MSDDIVLGVIWLHRAGKLVDHDLNIIKEIDFISYVLGEN